MVQHKTSQPDGTKVPLDTTVLGEMRKGKDGERQIPPQKEDDDRIPSNKIHGDDAIQQKAT